MAGIYPDSGVPAGQATNTVDVDTVNCGDGELFYSTTRCQPRFDPAAANAVISEILNVVKCAGNEYDCDRLDNLCLAIEQIIVNACLDVPDIGTVCGTTEQLMLYTDDEGCSRLARVSVEAKKRTISGPYTVWSHVPPGASGYTIPDDLPQPTNFYTAQDYQTAGGTNTTPYQGGIYGQVREAAGLNAGRISNSRYAVFDLEVPCDRRYELTYNFSRDASQDVSSYTVADTARTYLAYRMRYYVGTSWTPWLYPYQASTGVLGFQSSFSATLPFNQFIAQIPLKAGRVQIEFFYIGSATGNLKLGANTFDPTNDEGAPQPRVDLIPIFD